MKNIFLYYLLAIAPFGLLIWLSYADIINSTGFAVAFLLYVLIYRTYIDGKRLADKGIIEKNEIWKMIIPGMHFKYFRELYLD